MSFLSSVETINSLLGQAAGSAAEDRYERGGLRHLGAHAPDVDCDHGGIEQVPS